MVTVCKCLLDTRIVVQVDHSGCAKPHVDIKTKVSFLYEAHVPKAELFVLMSTEVWHNPRCLKYKEHNLNGHHVLGSETW